MNPLEARRRILGRNVYKRTTEGNPAIAQGSLARMYPGITMQGWTEQAQYEGKNLFSIDDFDSNNKATIQNGAILFNQSLGTIAYNLSLDPGAYSISIARDGYSGINIKINEVAVIDNGGSTNYTGNFDVRDGDSVVLEFAEGQNPNGEDRIIYDIMLNSGSAALPYEPYTGRQPSPSPDYPQEIVNAGKYDEATGKYQYEVKLTGKNMLPSYSELSDWKPLNYMYIPVTGFIIGETYTVSQSVVPNLGEGFYVGLGSVAGDGNKGVMQWIYHSSAPSLCVESETFVATQETYYLNVSGIYNQSTLTKFLELFPQLMVELGTGKTEYESYKEQVVTLTSDRLLTKWDKLTKKNGVWGWEYGSAEIVCDGSETWFLTGVTSDEYQGFALKSSDYNAMKSNLRLVCDKFAYSASDEINTCKQEKAEYGLRFVVSIEYVPNKTVADWENWLQSNPITVLYQLAEPTFAPLSASEQEAMNELYTFRPTTVLSNDAGCEMSLTYKTKKSLQSVPGGGYKKA